MRVLIRGPKLARVERLDGTLLCFVREEPQTATPLIRRGDANPVQTPRASDAAVELDVDGFVPRRPKHWDCNDTDTAMVGSYYDVAMLDPLELADGHDGGSGTPVEDLRVVDHREREAWEAVLARRLPTTRAGTGHDIAIEAVNQQMDDDLFPPPEAARWSRVLRRS